MDKTTIKKPIIVTLAIWLILNITGISNVYFDTNAFETIKVSLIKILHLLFLYLIIQRIYFLYVNRKTQKGKFEIVYTLIFFAILLIILLLVWPGAWSWDDIVILDNAHTYNLTPWQHFFSGLFYILCLQTIPIASGVMIIQIIIASLIIGYCSSNIAFLFGKNTKQIIIIATCILIFSIFPPVVLYILSGFRMGIYSFLELLLITKLLITYKEKKQIKIQDMFIMGALTVVISCWRTEAIYYPFLLFIMLCILGKKIISKKAAIIVCLLICIINFTVGKYNNILIGNNNYSITATLEPLTSIVKIAGEDDAQLLDAVDKVIDVNYIKEHPEMTGEGYYWTDGVMRNYSSSEYSDYLKAYVKLSIKYPGVALESMWKLFINATSGQGRNNKQTTVNMFNAQNVVNIFKEGTRAHDELWSKIKSFAKGPLNLNIRNSVLFFFGGVNENYDINLIHRVFWNFLIPLTMMIFCLIYKVIKRDWYMVFLILTILARVPIVFVTEPASFFMYYLSAYLCSYVLSFIIIYEIITKKINKKEKANG